MVRRRRKGKKPHTQKGDLRGGLGNRGDGMSVSGNNGDKRLSLLSLGNVHRRSCNSHRISQCYFFSSSCDSSLGVPCRGVLFFRDKRMGEKTSWNQFPVNIVNAVIRRTGRPVTNTEAYNGNRCNGQISAPRFAEQAGMPYSRC